MTTLKMTAFAERMFPRARGNEALVSLGVVALGLAGGIVTLSLILFAR